MSEVLSLSEEQKKEIYRTGKRKFDGDKIRDFEQNGDA
jgi:hypothetical protein